MSENKTIGKTGLVLRIVFFCIFGLSLFFGLYLSKNVISLSDKSDSELRYIETWTVIDEAGNSFQTGRSYDNDRAFTEDFTIVSRLPENIGINSVLCFQNRSDVGIYINGELRKEFVRSRDTGIPGGSMKEFYLRIPLSTADSGAEVRMIRGKTDWNPEIVPETFITSNEGVYRFFGKKFGLSFCTAVFLFVAALLSTIIAIVLRIRNGQTIDLLYASIGILDVACWLLSVSQITPVVTGVYYVDGLMGFLFCMMMPFSLLIYINSIQKDRYKKIYTILFIASLINYAFWSIMHFTGIQTFQNSIIYIDSFLGLVIITVLATLTIDIKNGHIKEYAYTAIGFLIFMIMSLSEIIVIIFSQNDTNQISMLTGLFCLLALVIIQQMDDIRKTRERLENEVTKKNEENQQMLIHIVKTLAGTIDAKDNYTNGHSSRVADYSAEIARRCGYSEAEQNDIYMMALLHDIGKIGIPDAVINKKGKLSDEEYETIRSHPLMGAKILTNIEEKTELSIGARWHHERYDGKGYPDGLKGDEIPEQARIIAVADAYDAMTSFRSYRRPMTQEQVRKEFEKGSGTQFDPRFAGIIIGMISEDKDYVMRENKSTDQHKQDVSELYLKN